VGSGVRANARAIDFRIPVYVRLFARIPLGAICRLDWSLAFAASK
jgi:hypothetical protein